MVIPSLDVGEWGFVFALTAFTICSISNLKAMDAKWYKYGLVLNPYAQKQKYSPAKWMLWILWFLVLPCAFITLLMVGLNTSAFIKNNVTRVDTLLSVGLVTVAMIKAWVPFMVMVDREPPKDKKMDMSYVTETSSEADRSEAAKYYYYGNSKLWWLAAYSTVLFALAVAELAVLGWDFVKKQPANQVAIAFWTFVTFGVILGGLYTLWSINVWKWDNREKHERIADK